jgi:hypothetical protein
MEFKEQGLRTDQREMRFCYRYGQAKSNCREEEEEEEEEEEANNRYDGHR